MWDSMCQAAIRIVSKSLDGVTNAELLLKIKEDVALFVQTMEVSFARRVPVHVCR